VGHLGGIRARGDHVGLKEGPFQKNVVVVESLVASSQHNLGDISTTVNVMGPIDQDLRLDDWDEAVLLADDGITG
jgi:hypothetical protein